MKPSLPSLDKTKALQQVFNCTMLCTGFPKKFSDFAFTAFARWPHLEQVLFISLYLGAVEG